MEKIEDEEVQLIVISQQEIEEKIVNFIKTLKGREVSRKYFIQKLSEKFEAEGLLVSDQLVTKILSKLEQQGLLKLEKRKIKIF